MFTLAQWIARLTKGYIKATGKKPGGLAKLKIKQEAAAKVKAQDKVIQFPKDRITSWWKPRPGEKAATTSTPIKKSISDEAATGHVQKLKEELPFMSRKELHQLRADVVNRKAYGSFDDVQRRELLDALTNQFTNKPEFASGGIAGQLHLNRPGYFKGSFVKWLAKNSPYQAYKKYLKYVKEMAKKDPAKIAPEMGALTAGSILVNRALQRKLKEAKEDKKAKGGIAGQLNRPGYFKGSFVKWLAKKSPLQRYKDYLKYVKETAKKDPAKIAPEMGALTSGSILVNRALQRKLQKAKEDKKASGGRVSYTKGGLAHVLGV